MSEQEQREVFSENLKYYLGLYEKSQKEVADAIGVSPQTFNTWIKGIAVPRMGKIELLSKYFRIQKTDLIDRHIHNIQEKYDLQVANMLNEIKNNPDLKNSCKLI